MCYISKIGSGTIRTKTSSSWDDSTGMVRTKFRTGLFAQHYWDGSLKIEFTGTIQIFNQLLGWMDELTDGQWDGRPE